MISDDSRNRYVKHPYFCVYCGLGSVAPVPNGMIYMMDIVNVLVACSDCKKEWFEVYHLVDIEESGMI